MASCDEVSGQSSDNVQEFPCTKCDEGNTASLFCTVCGVYYCVSCLPGLCQHKGILGRNAISKWGTSPATDETSAPGIECLRHPGRPIDMYCSGHDVVCCRLCYARSHRGCSTKSIKEADTSSVDKGEIPKLQEEIKQVQATIKQLKAERKLRKTKLGKSREGCEKQLQDYYNKLREMLGNLEKKTLEKMGSKFTTKNTKLQSDIEVCEQMETEINKLNQTEDDKVDQANVFIKIKRNKEWLRDNKALLTDMGKDKGDEEVTLVQDTSIEKALSASSGLVKLLIRHGPWKATGKKDINIKNSQEKGTRDVRNIAQLQDGSFVIIDYNNKSVKQFSKALSLLNICLLDANPVDICCVSVSEVAVSLNNKTIQFIAVDNGLTPTRSISLNHYCLGVAHKDGRLYVTDNAKSLYVYSLSGSIIQTFSKDKNGQDLFQQSYRIAFSHDGNLIYVTDYSVGLVTLDKNGNKLTLFQSTALRVADGVCVAEDGSVLVSGYSYTRNVIQVTAEGDKMIGEVVPKSAGVDPHGICIDRNNSRLLIAEYNKDSMCVFELAQEDI